MASASRQHANRPPSGRYDDRGRGPMPPRGQTSQTRVARGATPPPPRSQASQTRVSRDGTPPPPRGQASQTRVSRGGPPPPPPPKRSRDYPPPSDPYLRRQVEPPPRTYGSAQFYTQSSTEPESPPPVRPRHEFRRKRWGLCHPGIAIPVVGVLTLLLRVHPCIVCAVILLNPFGETTHGGWVTTWGPVLLIVQAIILVVVVILMFIAVCKESPGLLIPFIIVQILALGAWLLLTIYAVVIDDSTAMGLIIISGIGAVFDLWSMITIIAAYMDIRGYHRFYEVESRQKQAGPTPSQKNEHIRGMWRDMDRPKSKRYRRRKDEPVHPLPYRTRYAPTDTTTDDSDFSTPVRPPPSRSARKQPRMNSVRER